ncbi:MAG TPA: hypothetical protein VJS30_24005 [Paraburkholderia sp.]|nr:hypothetical protein [Paraburkholderia sp.]
MRAIRLHSALPRWRLVFTDIPRCCFDRLKSLKNASDSIISSHSACVRVLDLHGQAERRREAQRVKRGECDERREKAVRPRARQAGAPSALHAQHDVKMIFLSSFKIHTDYPVNGLISRFPFATIFFNYPLFREIQLNK